MIVLVLGASVLVAAYRYEPRVRPGTLVGQVPVEGLTRDEAARKLRIWWETEKGREMTLVIPGRPGREMRLAASRLGVVLDDQAIAEELPCDDFWSSAGRLLGQPADPVRLEPRYRFVEADLSAVAKFVDEASGERRPAKISFVDGKIVRTPEKARIALDVESLPGALTAALASDGVVRLPVVEAPKRVPDEMLNKVTHVIGAYSTRFSAGQVSRSWNIRLAAEKLDGLILLPGEEFSFNEAVGERTARRGYRLAGVYVQGRHDVGIGGGICQVSGTLYNAALLANLKITRRSNHSMPVPYLAVGRDAAVDYNSLDLRFRNNLNSPIAISSTCEAGRLTFRILGEPDPGLEVKIVTSGHRTWSRGVQYVHDGTLPAGKQRVVEKGSPGHAINTYRVLVRDGRELKRELVNSSRYGGGVRIIARNTKAASPTVASQTVVSPPTDEYGFE
ncbi:MAG: VanW family protein [Fimbriimonadaceae bacterium]